MLKRVYALLSFWLSEFPVSTSIRALSLWCLLIFSSAHADNTVSPTKVLVWGDSLSAAYGIPVEKGWVSLLKNKLGNEANVINASISGETTQGGLTRLPAALKEHKPDIMLLQLGGNDGLRGISTKVMKENLKTMIDLAHAQQIKVVLLGIKIPPNYGITFTRQFEGVFKDLAAKYQLGFMPFILEGIATDYALMQADGLHPNVKAQAILLNNIMPVITKAISSVR